MTEHLPTLKPAELASDRPKRRLAGLSRHPRGVAAISSLLLLCQLWALVLAGSHLWHHLFHDLDSSVDHQCLVTLLHNGQVEQGMMPESLVSKPSFDSIADRSHGFETVAAPKFLLLPGRAPPV